jgi:transposase InsO family protein
MQDPIRPKDPAEAIALYRAQIVGPLVRRTLERGDLAAALGELTKTRFCPPRSHGGRTYSVATLERWYYAFKEGGLDALRPKVRSDRGRGRDLTDGQKQLLLDVRRENPDVSVETILRTLVLDGRIERGSVAASTLRRFFAEQGFDRRTFRAASSDGRQRLRWQAAHPGALWQGDVCHGSPIVVGGKPVPVRIHALLDDASRYVVAIEARHQEREVDMLAVLIRALRRFGAPDALYLDNGATYRGETLSLACARLGTALVHAKPYDAPARGKMERFWRTLRDQCLVFCKDLPSLHDVNVRLIAWLDEQYHKAPHGGLLGKTPAEVFDAAPARTDDLDETKLRRALTVRERRRVRRDNTLAMDGADWETSLHFLAGRLVTVARSLIDADDPPWIEYDDKVYPLSPVDPVKNARRERAPTSLDAPHAARVPFDPTGPLVDRALGRTPKRAGGRDDEEVVQ